MKFKDLRFEHQGFPLGYGTISRARVNFPNGNGLSIVYGMGTYTSPGTYEIAPLMKDKLIFIGTWGDEVKGCVTKEQIDEVLEHAEKDSPEKYIKFLGEYLK